MSKDRNQSKVGSGDQTELKRSLTLPLLTLYGLGVTIGAGIYVLVGAAAAKAGIYTPISFLLAACVVGFTGYSYCELATRYPVSAGEAAYVREGFNSRFFSLLVGLMVVASGVVSSAAISIGAAAYIQTFVFWSPQLLTIIVILVVGLIAVWGILESVMLAALFTLIEISGLGLAVWSGLADQPEALSNISNLVPPMEIGVWSGIYSAGLLALFAFVGFEDIANVAEEVKLPHKTLPRGILLTLVISTLIYFIVVTVVVLVVPMDTLVTSSAPLALVFKNSSPAIRTLFNVIAILATVNGALIQIIMASRVLYGLASQGSLPGIIAKVNVVTRTPLVATALVVIIVLFLALFLPITELAEVTSTIILFVFSFVNLALLRIKYSGHPVAGDVFLVPIWVPVVGFISCAFLILSRI
jgi:basic amino acid/polyamine antiporter, APA family